MSLIKYTPEQADILDYVALNEGMVLVSAGAGSGKTFLAERLIIQEKPVKALYTAFNKAIVEEGKSKLQKLGVECRTFHSLAYSKVKPKQDIQDITYKCITEKLSYKDKYEIIKALDMFFVSASTDMYDFFEEYFEGNPKKELLAELAPSYIEKMVEGKINPTFNFLLKYFHLLLVEGSVSCKYDLVILDEINDTTAVALEIFKHITAPRKIGLGETNQAIYDFLNLVNGFEKLTDYTFFRLTKSFRCSEKIASSIQKFMRNEVTDDFKFIGTDQPIKNGKTLYCTLTNASIIRHIQERITEGKGFNLLRKLSEIFAFPMAIVSAGQGKQVYQKKFKFLEEEFLNYQDNKTKGLTFLAYLAEHVTDQETKSAINLLLSLYRKNINIFSLYKQAQDAEVDLNYTIATVFTAKGLEYETVYIADDMNNRIDAIRGNGGIKNHEDLVAYRCYYVACSRCGSNLRNAKALPF